MIQKTPSNNINISIITLFLRNKSFQSVKSKHYDLSYNCIHTLIGAYIYTLLFNKAFRLTNLYRFIEIYQYRIIKKYVLRLVDSGMITLAGKDQYILTDTGYNSVIEIVNNMDNLVYSFCDKHNIVL